MFSVRFCIFLLIVLFISFLLRLFGEEPYPAVLLPSNASTINKNEDLVMETTRLFGVRPDGTWGELNRKVFFEPIPFEHTARLMANNLELQEDTMRWHTRKYRLYQKLGIFQNQDLPAGQLREVKEWIRSKLAEQGFTTTKIRVSVFSETISLLTGQVMNSEVKNQNTYSLDR